MSNNLLHEEIYRGAENLRILGSKAVTICGVGAIGSVLADNLARQGFRRLKVIDCDRIESHNVNTQVYGLGDVGAWKVDALRNHIFRATEIEIETESKRLNDRNARSLLGGADLVIDAFDNSASRSLVQQACREAQMNCLHVGLYADYCEVIWDASYRVPRDVAGDVCEYPLARNLVLLAVALASETVIDQILADRQANRSATLKDFAVTVIEDATS